MKKFIMMLLVSVATLALGLVGLSSPSFAGGSNTPTCTVNDAGTTLCSSASAGAASTSISITNADKATAKGVTNVYFVQSKGATKAQKRGTHYTLKHATTLKTSWRVDRGFGWHAKTYPKGYTFIKGKDGYWHDPKCWNSVVGIPKGKTKVGHMIRTKIIVHQYWTAKATAKATASGSGVASASCTVNGASAFAKATYELMASATASATVKGSSWASASAAARSAAQRKLSSLKSQAQATAMATASVKASASAVAGANCFSSSTPGTPVPPTCESVYGPGYTGTYPNCTKDGTTTPAPPTTAPGPNPTDPPVGQPGGSGSHQCWSETTGLPVDALPNGTCPPGSFGA